MTLTNLGMSSIGYIWANTLDGISSAFTAGYGLGLPATSDGTQNKEIKLYGRLSGKTYQWYGDPNDIFTPAASQFNMAGATYLYIAIG